MSQLDPVVDQTLSFIFPRCQARLDGDELVVTVPSPGVLVRCGRSEGSGLRWDAPIDAPADVVVECAPGEHQRTDGREYPVANAYTHARSFRFRGAVCYGRIPFQEGWALSVSGSVQSIEGLPDAASSAEAVLVEAPAPAGPARLAAAPLMTAAAAPVIAAADGPNGPHLPFP